MHQITIYTSTLEKTIAQYEALTGSRAEYSSPAFAVLKQEKGADIAVWQKPETLPPGLVLPETGYELNMFLPDQASVDEHFRNAEQAGFTTVHPPRQLPFGYGYLVIDQDGHAIRVLATA